jgi:hypothetical protein
MECARLVAVVTSIRPYSAAVVERTMNVQAVILKAMAGKLKW